MVVLEMTLDASAPTATETAAGFGFACEPDQSPPITRQHKHTVSLEFNGLMETQQMCNNLSPGLKHVTAASAFKSLMSVILLCVILNFFGHHQAWPAAVVAAHIREVDPLDDNLVIVLLQHFYVMHIHSKIV